MTPSLSLTTEVWIDFEGRLRGYVRRRVDPASVDDLVAAILLRLVQHQEDLRQARNPIAWALTVAANAVADHHRRRASARRTLAEAEGQEAMQPASEDDDETAASGQLARCLVPLIRSLPERYGEALMLTEIEGMTQAAAARQLGLSVSGMKSRVQRGRQKLKDALLRCCTIQIDGRGGVIDYRRRTDGQRPRC